jgi:hypothetical protein
MVIAGNGIPIIFSSSRTKSASKLRIEQAIYIVGAFI